MQIRNLNGKRICDISENKRRVRIQRNEYSVIVRVDNDGDLEFVYQPKEIRKRIFDMCAKKRVITIRRKDCNTYITANSDRTLSVKSSFSVDILSELVESARIKMIESNEKFCKLNKELNESDEQLQNIQDDYNSITKWANIFDESDMSVKKMIAGYIINKVYVGRNYELDTEFNVNLKQFGVGEE